MARNSLTSIATAMALLGLPSGRLGKGCWRHRAIALAHSSGWIDFLESTS